MIHSSKKFSTVEALRFGFYTVIENILFFLALWCVIAAVFAGGTILSTLIAYFPFLNTIISFLRENSSTFMNNLALPKSYLQLDIRHSGALIYGTLLFGLLLKLIYRFVSLGLTRISLDFYDYKTSSIKQLFSQFHLLFRGFVAGSLYSLMVAFGTLFFIIPGIYLALKYGFYEQLLVDKNTGILESFQESGRITHNAKWSILGLLIIFFFINVASFIFLGLGFIVAYPAFMLAYTYVYRKLLAVPVALTQNSTQDELVKR